MDDLSRQRGYARNSREELRLFRELEREAETSQQQHKNVFKSTRTSSQQMQLLKYWVTKKEKNFWNAKPVP